MFQHYYLYTERETLPPVFPIDPNAEKLPDDSLVLGEPLIMIDTPVTSSGHKKED
jgi:hypothetical protein